MVTWLKHPSGKLVRFIQNNKHYVHVMGSPGKEDAVLDELMQMVFARKFYRQLTETGWQKIPENETPSSADLYRSMFKRRKA